MVSSYESNVTCNVSIRKKTRRGDPEVRRMADRKRKLRGKKDDELAKLNATHFTSYGKKV